MHGPTINRLEKPLRKKVLVFKLSALIGCLYFLSSCATHQSRLSPAQRDLLSGNCAGALKILGELSAKQSDDRLLYLMEYGSALQICKDYKASTQVFLQADKLSEELDYISASRVVGATLFNEEMIQYKGDIFERLFINISLALNYIEVELYDDAMVEVRRINEKYNKFKAEEKNSYELNSFSQYLSGLIWETQNKFDDACISYKDSYKLDATYRDVALDMLSACWQARRTQEFNQLVSEIQPTLEELSFVKRKNKGEVIVIFLQGLGPKKMPRPDNHLYPYLVPTRNLTEKIVVTFVDGSEVPVTVASRPVYNVEKAAIATQEADYASLGARRLGARVAKEVAADQIRQKDKTLGNIAWLVMVASERADLRNWSLLPESIQILRINPLKNSKVNIVGMTRYGAESEKFPEIDLSLHQNKKIFILRSIK